MSPILRVLLSAALLVLIAGAPSIEGSASGKHNQASAGCTCHYNGANGITANHNFPTTYTPGTTYSIIIDGSGGSQSFVGGFSLQVNKGLLSNAGSLVQISGPSATHSGSGALSWTMDWTAPASGSGSVNVALAVLQANANAQNSGDSWDTTTATIAENVPQNQPPMALNLRLMPEGNVPVDEAIMISYIFDDADGDSESNSQIRWSKDGVLVPAYNDLMNLPASATSVGETWTVSVTPNDGKDFGSTEDCPDSAMIIDIDTDGDGTMDMDDDFPNDASETTDTDGDGVGDNADVFPNDASETTDTDGDGVGDNGDAFPNDASETLDTDGDGVGDNADIFPNDATETLDTDGDGVGDNGDAFPDDATETLDSDNDTVGDNADAFPNDASETLDADGDGVGDNADAFPNDATETLDSDGDGVGDNADAFPNDASETLDADGDGVGNNAQLIAENLAAEKAADEEAAQKQMMTIIVIVVILLGGIAGTVLFLRTRGSEEDDGPKDFTQQSMPTPIQSVQQTYQQPVVQQPVQQTYQQPVVQQPAVVAEPTVLQQWTDEAGYTWRAMDDGSTLWWTGTEWQKR